MSNCILHHIAISINGKYQNDKEVLIRFHLYKIKYLKNFIEFYNFFIFFYYRME